MKKQRRYGEPSRKEHSRSGGKAKVFEGVTDGGSAHPEAPELAAE